MLVANAVLKGLVIFMRPKVFDPRSEVFAVPLGGGRHGGSASFGLG